MTYRIFAESWSCAPMLESCRALVRPRVQLPMTGEALLLEDLVADALRESRCAPIQIIGGPGSGKTTALRHLWAVLPDSNGADVVYLDEPDSSDELTPHRDSNIVLTTRMAFSDNDEWTTWHLAPWSEDDLMEYLLARHPARCGTVLAELRAGGGIDSLHGIPELWALTLDFLANQPPSNVMPLLKALRVAFMAMVSGADQVHAALEYGLGAVLRDDKVLAESEHVLRVADNAPVLLGLLRHEPLHKALAVGRIAGDLDTGAPCRYLSSRLPRSIIVAAAEQIREHDAAVARVRQMLTQTKDKPRHPMAASLCHQLDRAWLAKFPATAKDKLNLAGAYLDHAVWPGVDLERAQLTEADLSFAELSEASLREAVALRAVFHGATLIGAHLRNFAASQADFTDADLRQSKAVEADFRLADFRRATLDEATFYRGHAVGADFTEASLIHVLFQETELADAKFAEADLTRAVLNGAKLARNDFRTARLEGTSWRGATLKDCIFEEVTATEVDFTDAVLHGALWTGSTLTEAIFAGADLRDAGLAEIDWEQADLRNADLRGVSFHLGSSRSGLVGSPIAREGSMTGFYTDDLMEQDFKSPEEIRKANLRGADLRGANIDGVDFYLVDLRDAKYDDAQAEQLRASGAILRTRGT
jgi:uncharacterized protein YjbI with pentapeptide repeats